MITPTFIPIFSNTAATTRKTIPITDTPTVGQKINLRHCHLRTYKYFESLLAT